MNHVLKKIHPSLKTESILIVGVQLLCIAFLLLTGPWVARSIFLIFVQLIGLSLIIWGYIAMRHGKFTIFPNVKHGTKLIMNGPYEIIRHPMYAGILLITIVLVIDYFSFFRVIAFLIIVIDLVFKAHLEEVLLEKHFGEDYETYRKKTHMIIPYLY